ncbi:hypothetical protein THERMOS_1639 [Bathymodiolus thermophilus thioautotrophic gill symbiont]|uniref:Uncharacterized protein n=1 Tax=Bathymodiolus thermophilus thioautotrophic gill symbiont TaxID=2360 RepID=A0A8H8XC69_9GAMM|nr:hypothetical protein THERMOS_1639 [Bathymodiolus thermophilus thioautotrophic gill symbiont]
MSKGVRQIAWFIFENGIKTSRGSELKYESQISMSNWVANYLL